MPGLAPRARRDQDRGPGVAIMSTAARSRFPFSASLLAVGQQTADRQEIASFALGRVVSVEQKIYERVFAHGITISRPGNGHA